MSNTFKRLERWFLNQCNDDWEHQYGVKIDTLDNPGWSVRIDLFATPLQAKPFSEVNIERAGSDWVHGRVSQHVFEGYGGTANLEEILRLFLDWAEQGNA